MPTVSTMAPFHLLHQEDQREMQSDFFGHVMVSYDANVNVNSLITGTTTFV